ncbi:MAG TPA: GntR family transcriptional regulator [Steroidobacteraceae bacterium]|nr:GntR family transcriptional regulator [Steroidobacteraceae bacterium]
MAPVKSRPIKRQSVPETLRESLQERILSGEIREGDWLIQDAIAEEYDVSRMPVREALRQLEACGLVLMRTHRGAIVTSIPTEQVEELFELRAMLECDVLRQAVARMTERDIAEARAVLNQLDASYAQGDIGSWGRLNWAFHRRLYEAAGRVQTLNILQGINLQIERYVRLHLLLTQGADEAVREHHELLKLCAARATDAAVAHLREHILGTRTNLVTALRAHRATPAA